MTSVGHWYLVIGHLPKVDPTPKMNAPSAKPWLPLALLAGALVIWAGLFAAGAYLEMGADEPHHDLRKPLIIMGCMAAFLAFWGLALWLRKRRGPKKP
jgi:membrane protein DedA with SNARE-associated domain